MKPGEDRPPSRDELLAMAYVDGELAEDARIEFESRMAAEPSLRREVAELRQLAVVARQNAPPEPMDFEWERLEKEWVHTGGRSTGLLLVAVGVFGLAGWGVWSLLTSDLSLVPRGLFAALLLGGVLLFAVTLRARLRTLPYDPYTQVKR